MTVDEFLAWAMAQPEGRFELIDGVVVAMAPERAVHARRKAEIWLALRDGIKAAKLSCEALPDGMTVQITSTRRTSQMPGSTAACRSPTRR